jgi:hypothetical protein
VSDKPQSQRLLDHLGIPVPVTGLWYLIPTAFTFGVLGLLPMRSWDYWWHLTLGHLVNLKRAIPAENLFLYTSAPDASLPTQPWLGQLLLSVGQATADVYMVLMFRNIVAAAGVWWLTRVAIRRCGDVRQAVLVVLAATPFVIEGLKAGPMIFGWALFGLILALAYHLRHGASRWWALGIPVLVAAWANLATGLLLALLLVLGFGLGALIRDPAESRRGLWGLVVVGILGAVVATPYGPEIYVRWVDNLPTHLTPEPLHLSSFVGIWFLGSLGVLGWIAATRTDRVDPLEWLLTALFAPVVLLYAQTLAYWGILWTVIIASNLDGTAARADDNSGARRSRASQVATTLAGLALIIAPPLVQPVMAWRTEWTAQSQRFDVRSRPPMKGVVPEDTPWAAVDILKQRATLPHLFHSEKYGGFLAYFLFRDRPRRVLFTAPPYLLGAEARPEAYRLAGEQPNLWRGLDHQYDFGAAVLETSTQDALVSRLEASEGWWTISKTDGFAFFLRRDDA